MTTFRTQVPAMGINVTTDVPDVPDLPRYPTDEDRRRRKVALAIETRATRRHRDTVRLAVESALSRPGCYVPAPRPLALPPATRDGRPRVSGSQPATLGR